MMFGCLGVCGRRWWGSGLVAFPWWGGCEDGLMRLSKRAEYGLIATVRLAQRKREGGGYLRSRQIAEEEGLPAKFLEAILLQLKSAGILESKVGAGGGYRLVRDSNDVRVGEVVGCLEPRGAVLMDGDTDASSDVGRAGSRALREVNRRVVGAYESALGSITLADLLDSESVEVTPGSLGGASRFQPDVRSAGGTDRLVDEAAV